MRSLTSTVTASLIALGGIVAGTSANAATICFAFQDLETEFWVAGHKAITTTLADQGHTVLERNANEDANKQLEQIKDCIAQGVDGIIVIPQDGESAVTIVKEAQSADVPIAVFNRPGLALKALSSPAARALARFRIPDREAARLALMTPPAWVFLPTPHIPLSSTLLRQRRQAS